MMFKKEYQTEEKKKTISPREQVIAGCREQGLSERNIKSIPANYIRYGSALILKFQNTLPDNTERIVAKEWAQVLNARTVMKKTGIIKGVHRKPQLRILFGPGGEVRHRENGIDYAFDPEKIMFSPGNITERKRMAEINMQGETVVDLFAGIGYFSLPAAVHSNASKIYSCEINPTAFTYLEKNITLNNANQITPLAGDCRETAPGKTADRVFMGYVGTTHHFLPTALNALKSKGIIHYHETCPVSHFPEQPKKRIEKAVREYGSTQYEIINFEKVKSYGPRMLHIVADVLIEKESGFGH